MVECQILTSPDRAAFSNAYVGHVLVASCMPAIDRSSRFQVSRRH